MTSLDSDMLDYLHMGRTDRIVDRLRAMPSLDAARAVVEIALEVDRPTLLYLQERLAQAASDN